MPLIDAKISRCSYMLDLSRLYYEYIPSKSGSIMAIYAAQPYSMLRSLSSLACGAGLEVALLVNLVRDQDLLDCY